MNYAPLKRRGQGSARLRPIGYGVRETARYRKENEGRFFPGVHTSPRLFEIDFIFGHMVEYDSNDLEKIL